MKNKIALLDNHPKISVKLMVQAAWPTQQDLPIEKGNFIFLLPFLLQVMWCNTSFHSLQCFPDTSVIPGWEKTVWLLHNIFNYIDKLMTTSVPVSFWHWSLQAKPMLWHPSEYCKASCRKMKHFLKYFSSIFKLIFPGNSVFVYFAVWAQHLSEVCLWIIHY